MRQEERQKIRHEIRKKRRNLTDSFQAKAANDLLNSLSVHPQFKHASTLALYLANDGELDLSPLIDWCWQHNKKIYLPIIHPFSSKHLLFTQYNKNQPMKKNKFGIKEPVLNQTQIIPVHQLDIICTPLVAFDASGARLGMGGGFYDRTLAPLCRHSNSIIQKPYLIGLAHDCQQVTQIPTESWDIPIPEIITPSQHILC